MRLLDFKEKEERNRHQTKLELVFRWKIISGSIKYNPCGIPNATNKSEKVIYLKVKHN